MDLLTSVRAALADRYDVHEVAGSGGMATVFRASRRTDGRHVAIKVLDPRLRHTLGPERFHREIAILSRLEHPAILPLLASGDDAGFLYYVMPFVRGETLREVLQREGQLPLDQAVSLARGVLAALQYAHGQNVLHRDIKPENILLEDGVPRVADFGIARAILRSADRASISSSGIVIGTPAYMSPEQAAGEARLDPRSDLYSTGCLLYEMLTGDPPFSGSTIQAIQARHLHQSPPSIRVVRPTVPEGLQAVVERALAKTPADRFGSAAEFSAALDRALTTASWPQARSPVRRRAWALGATFVALAAAATAVFWPRGPAVDPQRYVVFPFRSTGPPLAGDLSADNYTRLVWESLSRWRDLKVVDMAVVEDRLRQAGDTAPTLTRAIGLARGLGAGLLVWAELEPMGDSVEIRASLYRTRGLIREAVRHGRVAFLGRTEGGGEGGRGDPVSRISTPLDQLVLSLLPAGSDAVGPGGGATRYFGALRATLVGDSALAAWNLELARAKYREASAIDPSYAAPRMGFARAALWADEPVSEWKPAAEAALTSAHQLSEAERLEAEALVALGQDLFPRACDRFRALVDRDSLSFAGWFGTGECLTQDPAVIPDPRSPSGKRFRGDYTAGIDGYLRALTLVPLAHRVYDGAALARLSSKLLAETSRLRFGAAIESGRRYAARPMLERDSVVLIPYPIEEVLAGEHTSPTHAQAVAASRLRLLTVTAEWLARYPDSPGAIRAHAWALELAGRIESATDREPGALGLVSRLRASRGSGADDLELAAWQVRLLVKSRQFTRARVLADSVLAIRPGSAAEGRTQAGLAALTGRPHLAAGLLARFGMRRYVLPDGVEVEAPPAVAEEANRLLVYAGFGGPADSLRAIADRLHAAVGRHVIVAEQDVVLEAALFRPSLLAFPALPRPRRGDFAALRIEGAIARGDTAAVRREFDRLEAARRFAAPGDIAPDQAVLEARLLALVGDTAASRTRWELLLDGVTALGSDLLDEVTEAAALGRAMHLYHEISGGARQRGLDTALAALWRHADDAARSKPDR